MRLLARLAHTDIADNLLMVGLSFIAALLVLLGVWIFSYLFFAFADVFGFFFYFLGGLLALGALFGSVLLVRMWFKLSALLFGPHFFRRIVGGYNRGSPALAGVAVENELGDVEIGTCPKITDFKYLSIGAVSSLLLLLGIFSKVVQILPDNWELVRFVTEEPAGAAFVGFFAISIMVFSTHWEDKKKYRQIATNAEEG